MVVEFQVREAINSLVALLRVAEDSAVHHYEQDDAFHPGIFPGLILLARLAADRAGEEFRQAVAAAEQIRKLNESCDELRYVTTDRDTFRDGLHELKKEFDQLQQQLAQVTAERDAALKRVAELSGNSGELPAGPVFTMEAFDRAVEFYNECLEQPAEPAPEWHRWNHDTKLFHQRHPDVTRGLHDATAEDMERMYCNGWRELPETEPEPYQWQNGDTVRDVEGLPSDVPYTVKRLSCGRVALIGLTGMLSQADWEKYGFELHRRASDLGTQQLTPRHVPLDDDLPDIPPPTPQQVAEFAEATEPIDDSVGTDGEGQS